MVKGLNSTEINPNAAGLTIQSAGTGESSLVLGGSLALVAGLRITNAGCGAAEQALGAAFGVGVAATGLPNPPSVDVLLCFLAVPVDADAASRLLMALIAIWTNVCGASLLDIVVAAELAAPLAAVGRMGDRLRCVVAVADALDILSDEPVLVDALCLGVSWAAIGDDAFPLSSRRAVAMTMLSCVLTGPAVDRVGNVLIMSGNFLINDSSSSES